MRRSFPRPQGDGLVPIKTSNLGDIRVAPHLHTFEDGQVDDVPHQGSGARRRLPPARSAGSGKGDRLSPKPKLWDVDSGRHFGRRPSTLRTLLCAPRASVASPPRPPRPACAALRRLCRLAPLALRGAASAASPLRPLASPRPAFAAPPCVRRLLRLALPSPPRRLVPPSPPRTAAPPSPPSPPCLASAASPCTRPPLDQAAAASPRLRLAPLGPASAASPCLRRLAPPSPPPPPRRGSGASPRFRLAPRPALATSARRASPLRNAPQRIRTRASCSSTCASPTSRTATPSACGRWP